MVIDLCLVQTVAMIGLEVWHVSDSQVDAVLENVHFHFILHVFVLFSKFRIMPENTDTGFLFIAT